MSTATAPTPTWRPSREAPRPARPATSRVPVVLALVLLAATAYGGVRVATGAARAPVGQDVPTLVVGGATFRVTHVERVNGLTNADLSGMGHGIQGLVLDDSTMVRVSVTVSAGSEATRFDASRLRLLRPGRPAQAPLGGSVGRGTLRPRASVEGAVAFVVPRDGARLRLGATGTGAAVALVRIDDAPPGAGHMDMSDADMNGMTGMDGMDGTNGTDTTGGGAPAAPRPHHHTERK